MTDDVSIIHAQPDHAGEVAPLFDAYRCWYGQASDPAGCRRFLTQRLRQNQSELFFARRASRAVGFVQLYPLFSSVALAPVWQLNDLFVAESDRRTGIATLLLETAVRFAESLDAVRLDLAVLNDNTAALALYESAGWKPDTRFQRLTYQLTR